MKVTALLKRAVAVYNDRLRVRMTILGTFPEFTLKGIQDSEYIKRRHLEGANIEKHDPPSYPQYTGQAQQGKCILFGPLC